MPRTYGEIIAQLKPTIERSPERFMRFYDKVYLLLSAIPAGKAIFVREHCTERSREIFLNVAEMVIIEDHIHRDPLKGWLDFNDDKTMISRGVDVTPIRVRRHFYTDKNGI